MELQQEHQSLQQESQQGQQQLQDDINVLCRNIREGANSILTTYLDSAKNLTRKFGVQDTNALLFRDLTIYMELSAAIKAGYIGRIEEVLKSITILFQSGSNKNYGIQLLRLAHDVHNTWGLRRKKAIFTSWLVNTSGKRNGFIATDMFQEHVNMLTKHQHRAHQTLNVFDHMAKKSSMTIHVLGEVQRMMEEKYDTPHNSAFHSAVDASDDIRRIAQSLKENNIFGKTSPPLDEGEITPVVDTYQVGFEKLVSGRLDAFVATLRRDALDVDGEDDGEEEEEDDGGDDDGDDSGGDDGDGEYLRGVNASGNIDDGRGGSSRGLDDCDGARISGLLKECQETHRFLDECFPPWDPNTEVDERSNPTNCDCQNPDNPFIPHGCNSSSCLAYKDDNSCECGFPNIPFYPGERLVECKLSKGKSKAT